MIEEPPPAAELDLSPRPFPLKTAAKGRHRVVVRRIQVVENHLGQVSPSGQFIHISGQAVDLGPIPNGIEASVRTQITKPLGVTVPESAEMNLLGPSTLGIQLSKIDHEKPFVGFRFLWSRLFPFPGGRVDPGGQLPRSAPAKRLVHSVIRNPAAELMKELMSLIQGLQESMESRTVDTGCLLQTLDPRQENLGLIHHQGFIRTKRWVDPRPDPALPDFLMIHQIITRVVCRSHHPNPELLEDLLSRKSLQFIIGFSPDFGGGRLVQYLLDAKDPIQLQMSPVPKGIANEPRHRLGIGQKLLVGLGLAGDVTLWDPVGTHRPPFVMIPPEPDLGQIGPLLILRDLLGGEMAVIIVNGLLRGRRIQLLRRLGGEEKTRISDRILDRTFG